MEFDHALRGSAPVKSGRSRFGLVMAGLCLALAGTTGVLVERQIHQVCLDRALILAVMELDPPAVTRLLDQGANANARDTDAPPLTFSGLMVSLWQQVQHKNTP